MTGWTAALLRAPRDSEERYRLVAEAMTEALLLLDLEGGLVLLNGHGEQLTGYRADELVGRSVFSVLDEAGAARARERLGGREVAPEFECVMVRKDGRRVPVEMVCTSIARDGHVAGHLVVARDIISSLSAFSRTTFFSLVTSATSSTGLRRKSSAPASRPCTRSEA